MMMMTSASASGGDGGVAGSLSEVQRPTGSSTAIAKFCSTDGRALGFALAGRGSERSAEFGRITHIRCPHARARGWAARCCSTCSIGLVGAAAAGRTAIKTICRSKSAKIGNRFNIPYEDVGHVIRLACIAEYKDSLCD
jgi:hypothetical protein